MVNAYPKVLVFSNEPFSKESSNGRTLGNLFLHYPKDHLAQLYTRDMPLDLIDCSYFFLSDKMVMNHLLRFKKPGEVRSFGCPATSQGNSAPARVQKNPKTALLRNALWQSGAYRSKALYSWLDSFNPDIVLLQAGDAAFMFHLARKFAKREQAKLVIYNSEDYYFKSWNYLLDSSGHKALYPHLHRQFRKAVKKAIDASSLCVYLTEGLKAKYDAEFPKENSKAIYTSTSWKPQEYQPVSKRFNVLYFGNFGGSRSSSLLQIAQALHDTGLPYSFALYGPESSDPDFQKLKVSPFCVYHPSISYEDLLPLVKESDVIVHAASFDEFNAKDRQEEFSSKIADCLASGRPFLAYGPSTSFFIRYLKDKNCAFVAESFTELQLLLNKLMADPQYRSIHLAEAKAVVSMNHEEVQNESELLLLLQKVTGL
jgi:hypothetical protein